MNFFSVIISIGLIALLCIFLYKNIKGLISEYKKRKESKALNNNNDKGGKQN